MSAFLRPFKHYPTPDLLNLLLVSKVTTYPLIVKSSDSLMSLSSQLIGLNPTSFYAGKFIGKVFSAGESLSDLKRTLDHLSSINQGIIIDYCAEGVKSESGMDETVSQIESAISLSSKYQNSAVAIKLTSLIPEHTLRKLSALQKNKRKSAATLWQDSIFLDLSKEFLEKQDFSLQETQETFNGLTRIRKICSDCEKLGVAVMIDAEQTYFQDAIDGITALCQLEFNKHKGGVQTTIQSYLIESAAKLEGYLKWSAEHKLKTGIKLVRGAYIREESYLAKTKSYNLPVHSSKHATDDCYNSNLKLAIASLTRDSSLCVASHNKESIFYAKELMYEYKIHRLYGGISFAQLLGMKTMISSYLIHENYVVQKYTPYGPFNKLMPYLGRRAHEMFAMIGEIDNQIDLVIEELTLRSNQ